MALLILGVGAVALAIVQSGPPAWSAGELWVAAAVGAGALAAFVAWAASRRSRWWTWRCSSCSYRYANLATLSFGIAFAMMFFAFFFYMMGVWHYSLPKAGLAVTPGPLLVMPTAIVTGRLAARMGHRPFLVGGAFAVRGGRAVVPAGTGAEPDYLGAWLPGLVLSGLSVGMVLPAGRRGRQPAAGAALCGGQRRQSGHAPDRRRAGRGDHGAVMQGRGAPADFDPLYMAHGAGLADGVAVPGGGHEADRDASPQGRRVEGGPQRGVRWCGMSGGTGLPATSCQKAGRKHSATSSGRPWRQNTERRAQMRAASSSRVSAAARRWRWRERARAKPAGGRRKASG